MSTETTITAKAGDVSAGMTNIAEFVRARLDDDESAARAATAGPWRYNPAKQWLDEPSTSRRALRAMLGERGEEFVGAGPLDATVGVATTGPADDPQSMADARHIARHDPARVLRRVAADRALLAAVDGWEHTTAAEDWCHSTLGPDDPCNCWVEPARRLVLGSIAARWSDHPEYRAEWAAGVTG